MKHYEGRSTIGCDRGSGWLGLIFCLTVVFAVASGCGPESSEATIRFNVTEGLAVETLKEAAILFNDNFVKYSSVFAFNKCCVFNSSIKAFHLVCEYRNLYLLTCFHDLEWLAFYFRGDGTKYRLAGFTRLYSSLEKTVAVLPILRNSFMLR